MPDTYAGVEQPDVASVEAGGEFFRCYVYKNTAANTIDGVIFVEQADGQEVIVWNGTIRDVETDGVTNALADQPRVLALDDGTFICHWSEYTGAGNTSRLYRASFDTQAMASGWVNRSYITVEWALWNHCITRAATVDTYCVVYVSGSTGSVPQIGTITVARFDGLAWADTIWSVTLSNTIDYRVLDVVSDNDAGFTTGVIAQEEASMHLRLFEVDTADGANEASSVVTTGHVDSEYTSVTLAQYPASSTCVFVAEYCTQADQVASSLLARQRGIIYRNCNLGSGAAATTSVQVFPNLHLASRAWIRETGFSDEYDVFVVVGFRTIDEGQGWNQSFGYVVRLNQRDWGASVPVSTIRPIICATLNDGSFDGRHSGDWADATDVIISLDRSKRSNHLPSASLSPTAFVQGPDVRTVVVAALFFEQTIALGGLFSEVPTRARTQAAVKGIRFYHEEPWTVRRDNYEPSLPLAQNFRGFNEYRIGQSVEVESGLVFAGGALSQYDGRQLVEIGFPWAPEIMDVALTTGGVANIEAGDYWVVAVYTWTDRLGGVHRSPPSTPVLVSSGVDIETITYRVRPINLTLKDDQHHYPGSSRVLVEFFRTTQVSGNPEGLTAGSMLLRRVFSNSIQTIEETPKNDHTVASFTVDDEVTNALLLQADLLPWQLNPTTLAWTPAIPTPTVSAKALAKWKNRLFSVSYSNPDVIQYSDELLPIGLQTAAPEHFDQNTYRFDSRGDIVAQQAMDNALIILTKDSVLSLIGEGNDGNGENASLQLQVIDEGTGCVEESSVVRTPDGIMFQAVSGFYTLTRGQGLDHASAGAAIAERIRTIGNVMRGTLLADRRIVRYVCNEEPSSGVDNPVMLDYNYELGIWSEQPLPNMSASQGNRDNAAQDGIEWRGREGQVCHVVISQNGMAVERADSSATYSDGSYTGTDVTIPMDVQTEWIHLSGMAGLKRVPVIGIQTERVNAGAMTVEAWYDFVGDFDESAPDETFAFASPAPAYLVCKPRSQKFSSVMLRIYESGTVPQTENVRLVSVTLKVAKKRGLRRVPITQIGT